MYGIYTNIGGILMVNVTIYSSTMDPMGINPWCLSDIVVDRPSWPVLKSFGPRISMANASFSWTDSVVLSNMAVSVTPGRLVLVVGPVASGKSTLLSGVFGFAQRTCGNSSLRGRSWERSVGILRGWGVIVGVGWKWTVRKSRGGRGGIEIPLRIGVEIREKRRWWNFGEVWWMFGEFQKQREFVHFQGDHCHCWCFQRETNAWDIPCRWWWWVGISGHQRQQMLFLFNS